MSLDLAKSKISIKKGFGDDVGNYVKKLRQKLRIKLR